MALDVFGGSIEYDNIVHGLEKFEFLSAVQGIQICMGKILHKTGDWILYYSKQDSSDT